MTSEIPPFTVRPECVKCGSDRVGLEVIQAIGYDPDILVVTCERCGFEWVMRTKDAAK